MLVHIVYEKENKHYAFNVFPQRNVRNIIFFRVYTFSDSFTILGLWVLGLAVSNINESQLQTYESKTLFLMTSLQFYCIPGLAGIKTYAQKMQDAQVTKSLHVRKRVEVVQICFSLGKFVLLWMLHKSSKPHFKYRSV